MTSILCLMTSSPGSMAFLEYYRCDLPLSQTETSLRHTSPRRAFYRLPGGLWHRQMSLHTPLPDDGGVRLEFRYQTSTTLASGALLRTESTPFMQAAFDL